MLPEWTRNLGKWRLLLVELVLLGAFSVLISFSAMWIAYGKLIPFGILMSLLVPMLAGTPTLYLLTHLLFELDQTRQDLQFLAITDDLTGAYNRRYLTLELEKEINRSQRSDTTFSLIMLDCDDFKSINDEYGHPVGDQFLIDLAQECKTRTRKTDTFSRIGGDEFILLLPQTSEEQAFILANQLREILIKTCNKAHNREENLFISFGVVSWSPEVADQETLFINLDKALYLAKNRGKNCVACYSEISQPKLEFAVKTIEPIEKGKMLQDQG